MGDRVKAHRLELGDSMHDSLLKSAGREDGKMNGALSQLKNGGQLEVITMMIGATLRHSIFCKSRVEQNSREIED